MRKVIMTLLAIALVFSFSACGESAATSVPPATTDPENAASTSEEHTHIFSDWAETTAATCTAAGEETRICTECGETESKETPALGHSFGEWEETVAATCTESGEESRKCSLCGGNEVQEIPATGHIFQLATLFAPKTCSACGLTEGDALATYISGNETLSAEDHSFYIADTYYTTKLSEKSGNTTYSFGSEGYYLVLKLKFTNLATEALEKSGGSRVSEMKLVYGNKYEYEGDFWILIDDIVPLATGNAYVFFPVPESMKQDAEKSIYAAFTIDGIQYAYVISWGNGDDWETSDDASGEITGDSSGNGSQEEPTSTATSDLSVGSAGAGESFEFTVSDAFYTTELKENVGSSTYYYSSSDENCLVIKLSFTNLATEAFERFNSSRVSDIKLTYNEKFNYDGEARVLVDDIVPLATGNLYIVYKVPETVKGAGEPLTASFKIDGIEFNLDCRANGL